MTTEQGMTEAIKQAAIEAVKAAIMAVREAHNRSQQCHTNTMQYLDLVAQC